jgi:hypothetical protein
MRNSFDKFIKRDTGTSSSEQKEIQKVDFAAGRLPRKQGLQELLSEPTKSDNVVLRSKICGRPENIEERKQKGEVQFSGESEEFLEKQRNLKPIKAPRDESFKDKKLDSLMPKKAVSSQEHGESQDKEELRRLQWERAWDAAMRQQELDDANKEVQWEGRKVSTNLSKQRRSERRSR